MPDSDQRAPLPPKLWLEGRSIELADDAILQLEVEERADGASSFRMVLDMSPITGDWDLLEHGNFAKDNKLPDLRLLTRVSIGLQLLSDAGPPIAATVMDGFVTAIEPVFGATRASDSKLIVSGLDASCLMHFETVTREWHGMTDADIARDIYRKYGFNVAGDRIEATGTARDQDRGAFIQRCTDAEFLRQLARRNGFEWYVEAGAGAIPAGRHPGTFVAGHFRSPRPFADADMQPELGLFPQDTPSLIEFRARWESHQPTRVRGWHLDDRSRKVQRSDITESRYDGRSGNPGLMASHPRADLLKERLQEILGGNPQVESIDIQTPNVPHDEAELSTLARADFRSADWFVRGSGTVRCERYPAILRPRRPVTLSGGGHLLDGRWYVQSVCHRWGIYPDAPDEEQTTPRYEADVEMVRNALGGPG